MATLHIVSIGQTGCQWYIDGLGYTWDTNQYSDAYITISGWGTSSPVYPPSPPGSGYSTGYGNISGLSAGTSYTATGYVVTSSNQTVNVGSVNFTTQAAPQPPSGIPSVSASAQSGHQIAVSWSSVSGATNYDVYADGTYKGSTSGTSLTISIDKEYYTYTIYVTPTNSAGTGNSGSTTVTTLDETDPTCSAFSVGTVGQTTAPVSASGYDNSPSAGNSSGLSGFYFYLNGSYVGTVYQSGGSASYTFSGLAQGTTYTLGCRAFDNAGNVSTMATQTITTTSRPANFSWTTAKTSGGSFNLSAAEWNSFTSRIDQFRSYKGLGAYGFTTANVGDGFAAYMFNQAVNGISAMSPPTAPPATRNTGDDIYASYLNDLVTSLNSIP